MENVLTELRALVPPFVPADHHAQCLRHRFDDRTWARFWVWEPLPVRTSYNHWGWLGRLEANRLAISVILKREAHHTARVSASLLALFVLRRLPDDIMWAIVSLAFWR
jgi:hypothetical protein